MTPQLIFLLCDDTPLSRAIVCASAPGGLLLDHVGILDTETSTVIEANAKHGVVETSLSDFLARAPKLKGDPGYRLPAVRTDGLCRGHTPGALIPRLGVQRPVYPHSRGPVLLGAGAA